MPIHHLWGRLQPPLLGSWEIWHRGVWGTEGKAELWSQLYLPAFFPPVSVDGETEAPRIPGTFSRSNAFCSSKGSDILRYSVPWTCLESQNLMLLCPPTQSGPGKSAKSGLNGGESASLVSGRWEAILGESQGRSALFCLLLVTTRGGGALHACPGHLVSPKPRTEQGRDVLLYCLTATGHMSLTPNCYRCQLAHQQYARGEWRRAGNSDSDLLS